jgi:hypothetical protein
MNNANNKKRRENVDKKNELHTKQKSTMSEGEKFWERLKKLPYSTDKIGQGFVIHISNPKKNNNK